jgi:hypothetical protein
MQQRKNYDQTAKTVSPPSAYRPSVILNMSLKATSLGGPTLQRTPQRECYCDYGTEHQGDDGDNVLGFHLRPVTPGPPLPTA